MPPGTSSRPTTSATPGWRSSRRPAGRSRPRSACRPPGAGKKTPRGSPAAANVWNASLTSGNVARDELGHLEHADLGFSAEHGLEGAVGVDHLPVLLVLEPVLLDVVPELLGELCAGKRLGADYQGEVGVWLHRFHERGVWFTSLFFGHIGFVLGFLPLKAMTF